MIMAPSLRKLALTAHVTSSVGWLGAAAAFLAVAIVGLTSRDAVRTGRAWPCGGPSAQFPQLGLHLVDLSLLARDDILTKLANLRVADGSLFAHENGSRVMRNHRSQELAV